MPQRPIPPQPLKVVPYIDVIRVWFEEPLSKDQLTWLRKQPNGRKLRILDGAASFDRKYKQRLTIFQPTHIVLQSLSTLQRHWITYLELSLDWLFCTEEEAHEAFEFASNYLVKSHHRDQGIRFCVGKNGTTRYTAARTAANNVVLYRDKPSKMSGGPCLHIDWRITGSQALRRAGFKSIRDLVRFNPRGFWQSRLKFFTVMPRDLGRRYWNKQKQSRRREPWVVFARSGHAIYDHHWRTGCTAVRALGSTQAVIDFFRRQFRVRDCLHKIDAPWLLPP